VADSKSAGEILETIIEDGREELERASLGLAFSGFAAGLNISFGMVALAIVASLTGGVGLAAYFAYPLGFLIVILGRAQLFTENTVTPVTVVLMGEKGIWNMLRFWAVVFVSNMVGTALFAAVLVYGQVLESGPFELLLGYAGEKLGYGWWTTFLKAIFGGWVVAIAAWLVAASRDTISQAFFVYALTFLIPAAGLVHCVAGAAEGMTAVFAGRVPFSEFLFAFLLPTTLGNIVGGVVLVTLLNYGQVIGSRDDKKVDEHTKKNREL
jgi:formate/nitrite transporter FocA (FNT family)